MAVKPATITLLGDRAVRAQWTLANGDTGEPINWTNYMDRSVQVEGTFGAGGTVTIEGSNDGNAFRPLSDMRGSSLAINTAKIEQVEDCAYFIRPNATAGDGTTALVVTLFARKVI